MKVLLSFLLTLSIFNCYAQADRPELVDIYCHNDCYSTTLIMGTINNQLMVATSTNTTRLIHTYTPTGLLRTDSFGDRHPYMFIRPVVYNNAFYYWGNFSGADYNLCRWDGNGTPQILTVHGNPGNIIVYNNSLYFSSRNDTGFTFYQYNLSTNTERVITDKMLTSGIVYKDKFYYSLQSDTLGTELHTFDPATDELSMVADIYKGKNSSYPYYFTIVDEKLYFSITTDSNASNLFMYDGIHPPKKLFDMSRAQPPTFARRINGIYPAKNKLYLSVNASLGVYADIYEYDIATGNAKEIGREYSTQILANLIAYRDEIFYTASDTIEHVFAYDMVKGTTRQIPDPQEISGNNMLRNFVYNDALYYSVNSKELIAGLYKYYIPLPYTAGTTLYPNPAANSVYIKTGLDTNNVLTIIMHDATGREVMQERLGIYNKGNHTIEIPLQHLAAGMYICTLRGSKNILYRGKLVKL